MVRLAITILSKSFLMIIIRCYLEAKLCGWAHRLVTGGFFDWGLGPITASLPSGHHVYAFQPGTNNKLVVATNLGIYYGTLGGVAYNQFTEISRNLTITQCYTVATGGLKRKVLTGTQGDGTWYISGLGNTPQYGERLTVDMEGHA